MLARMAGGGMGFIFDPQVKAAAQDWLQETMSKTKDELQTSLPFAMEPVVYDFAINNRGTSAELRTGAEAVMPDRYYALLVPGWLRSDSKSLSPQVRRELEQLGSVCRSDSSTGTIPRQDNLARALLEGMLPQPSRPTSRVESLNELLPRHGFDAEQHEQIRADLRAGRIGLAQNRLSSNVIIEDVQDGDIVDLRIGPDESVADLGRAAIADGQVAVVTLAAGIGSRWTEGAGVVKALHPILQTGWPAS